MLFEDKPENFNPKFKIASCFVETNNKILLLLRQDHKPEGNTWGIPTGKIEEGENKLRAMQRELREETGIIVNGKDILFLQDLFMRFPTYDFEASVFKLVLKKKPAVKINAKEHKNYSWIKISEAEILPLIYDLDNWIKYFYKNMGG